MYNQLTTLKSRDKLKIMSLKKGYHILQDLGLSIEDPSTCRTRWLVQFIVGIYSRQGLYNYKSVDLSARGVRTSYRKAASAYAFPKDIVSGALLSL